jgi:hypothetical protein
MSVLNYAMEKMRMTQLRVAAVISIFLLLGTSAAAEKSLDQALVAVNTHAIRAHMAFLADDLLEGREAGTRGYQLAARYVATQFELLGLQPAGDNNSWYQEMDLRRSTQVEAGCSFSLHGANGTHAMEYGVDYFMTGDANFTSSEVEAPVVFVGYGVTAPDMQYDDFAGIDVKGKIILTLRGAPPTFPHNQRAYYSREKMRLAEENGAVGVLTMLNPEDAAKRPWERRVQNSKIARMRLLDTAGQPLDSQPGLQVKADLSDAGMQALFRGAPQTLEQVFEAAELRHARKQLAAYTATDLRDWHSL